MNSRRGLPATLACALLAAALGGCADRGTVTGWIDKAEGDCSLPKTELKHGLAYVDGGMLKHGGAAKVEVLLSDASLDAIDIEQGFNPLFGKEAGSKQLYVIGTVGLHGLTGENFEVVHPTKRCVGQLGNIQISVDRFEPERVVLTVTPKPAPADASGPRDAAQFTLDLPLQWPKNIPAEQREKMVAETAARVRFEREAIAAYQELVKAVAAHDVAGVEQRVSLDSFGSMSSLLDEMVFGEPGETAEAAKLLPVVAGSLRPVWLYTRQATAPDVDWELKLALCDPADAARRAYADVKRTPEGKWLVSDVGDDADTMTREFGPAAAKCVALGQPAAK